jgi:hypothetical protein
MGMYDEVKCEYKLPDELAQNKLFQTKCMESLLDLYRISEDGELFITMCDREWEPDENSIIGGHMKIIKSWEDKVDFHGTIDIYTDIKTDKDEREWYEYRMKFTDGKVVDVTRVTDDMEDSY